MYRPIPIVYCPEWWLNVSEDERALAIQAAFEEFPHGSVRRLSDGLLVLVTGTDAWMNRQPRLRQQLATAVDYKLCGYSEPEVA